MLGLKSHKSEFQVPIRGRKSRERDAESAVVPFQVPIRGRKHILAISSVFKEKAFQVPIRGRKIRHKKSICLLCWGFSFPLGIERCD